MRLLDPVLAGAFEPLGLEVHFQPKVRLDAPSEAVSYEALLRGRTDEGAILSTKAAFSRIQSRSQSDRLTVRKHLAIGMLRRAAQASAALRAGVSVNIEPDMLGDAEFRRSAAAFAGGAWPITLEIIEEPTSIGMGTMAGGVKALREAGFRIALDDFGIAESNLIRLTHLAVDEVKIDAALLDYERGRLMLPHMVGAILALGAEACIEGVETREHHEIARLAGAGMGQGYLYGPPGPLRIG